MFFPTKEFVKHKEPKVIYILKQGSMNRSSK